MLDGYIPVLLSFVVSKKAYLSYEMGIKGLSGRGIPDAREEMRVVNSDYKALAAT